MARPLKRTQTAAPRFSSADLGIAVDAFRGAGQGFSRFSDTMGEFEQREDDQLTNEAIAARLRGEEVPFNRRVDQEAVRASFDARRLNESNLESAEVTRTGAGLTQEGQRLTNEAKTFTNSKQEQTYNDNQAELRSKTALNETRKSVLSSAEERAQAQADLTTKIKTNSGNIDRAVKLEEDRIYNEDIETNLPRQEETFRLTNPTASDEAVEAHLEEYRQTARDSAQVAGDSNLDTFVSNLASEEGYSPEAVQGSTAGQYVARIQTEGLARSGRALERQEENRKNRVANVKRVVDGETNQGVIFDPDSTLGYRVAEDSGERKGNKLSSSAGDVKAWLDKMGIPDTDDNIKKAGELITASGNNRSVMEGAVTADGAVDKDKRGGWIWDRKFVPEADWKRIEVNMKGARDGIDEFAKGYVDPEDAPRYAGSSSGLRDRNEQAYADSVTKAEEAAQDPGEAGNQAEIDLAKAAPLPSTTLNEKLIDAISEGVGDGPGTSGGKISTTALLTAPSYILNYFLSQREKKDREQDSLQEKLTSE